MKPIFNVAFILVLSTCFPFISQSCNPPEINQLLHAEGQVMIGFSVPGDPEITGFNFYRDNELIDYLEHTGDTAYNHFLVEQPPGTHNYCVTVLCNESSGRNPKDIIESEPDCSELECYYGFELPFAEHWDFGLFEANNWDISSDNWIISDNYGNEPPSAIFEPQNVLLNYEESLTSFYLNTYGMTEGHLYLTYDLSLSSVNSTGAEHFIIKVWDQPSGIYQTLKEYDNLGGSFGWTSDTIDIRPYCMGKVFKVQFMVSGENSSEIISWGLDNVAVERKCDNPVFLLESELFNDTCIFIEFTPYTGRDLIEVIICVTKDEYLIGYYSIENPWDPFPNPYCVSQPGEYCFYTLNFWESETDQCESVSNTTCEQVVITDTGEEYPEDLIFINQSGELCCQSKERYEQFGIYDLSGRMICNEFPGTNSFQKNISGLIPGIYIIKTKLKTGFFSRKLVIN